MRFLSLFSGIEAASVAWKPLGWTCVGVSEIDPFGRAALAQHYPHVPNLGDVSLITEQQIAALGRIDVLVFGSPCQDLSLAGKRKGFDGERSSLFFIAMRIVRWAREHCGLRFAVWENVPGAFSSNDGRDFAAVVGDMAGMDTAPAVPPHGWGKEGCAVGDAGLVEWSTLDAQWFGVAQRRRRCFVVADYGDWTNRPPILLESEGLRGDSPPQRGPGEDAAADADHGIASGRIVGALRATDGGPDLEHGRSGHLIVVSNAEGSRGLPFLTVSNLSKTVNNQTPLLAFAIDLRNGTVDATAMTLQSGGIGEGRGMCINAIPHTFVNTPVLSFKPGQSEAAGGIFVTEDYAPTLQAQNNGSTAVPAVMYGAAVRRLTPRECERLQAFPDDYTHITVNGKPAADTPRYRALGNSMCVNVMRWIGQSIEFAYLY